MIRTHNCYHLGDNIVHLNFLRRLAKANPQLEFEHICHGQYIAPLQSLITDLPQIKLTELMSEPPHSINAWRGVNSYWYSHPLKHDFAAFHVEHFELIALRMGLPSPIKTRDDLWMDAPILNPENLMHAGADVLLIDTEPQSNQWQGYSLAGYAALRAKLEARGLSVVSASETRQWGWGIAQIGAFAGKVKLVIGTANGPFWCAASIYAKQTVERWVMFTGLGEELRLSRNMITTTNMEDALEYL
jgi:hypothetical protein